MWGGREDRLGEVQRVRIVLRSLRGQGFIKYSKHIFLSYRAHILILK